MVKSCSRETERLAAHDPREVVDVGHGDRDDHVVEAGAEDGDQGDGENDHREGPEEIDRARDETIDPAAVVAGDETEQTADDQGDRRRQKSHRERHAGADDHSAEEIAAERIGAHGMLQAGLLQHPEVVVVGMIGREHRAEDRDERQQRDDDQTDDRLALAAQPAQKAKL